MQVTLADPLREPAPPGWDGFVAAEGLLPLFHAGPLTAVAWAGQAPTLLGLVADGPAVLGVFHVRLLGPAGSALRYAPVSRRPAGRRPAGPALAECRLHPVGSAPGYGFAAGLPAADRVAVRDAFERALRRRLGLAYGGVAYRQVPAADRAVLAAGRRVCLRVAGDWTLHRRWDDLDGYLAALPTKVRATARHARAATRDLAVGYESPAPAAELARLVDQVRLRHGAGRRPHLPVPPAYLAALPRTRYLTYRQDGRLIAAQALHGVRDGLAATFWGRLDPAAGGRQELYFDTYARVAEELAAGGGEAAWLGKGMAEVKQRYGAVESPRYAVIGR